MQENVLILRTSCYILSKKASLRTVFVVVISLCTLSPHADFSCSFSAKIRVNEYTTKNVEDCKSRTERERESASILPGSLGSPAVPVRALLTGPLLAAGRVRRLALVVLITLFRTKQTKRSL